MSAPGNDVLGPLIESMGTGDEEALQEFVTLVAPWIHGAQLRLSGNTVAAAYLVEETLKELWKTAPLYDPHWGPPMTWTMAVARLIGMEWLEKRRGKEHRLKSKRDADEVLLPYGTNADTAADAAMKSLDEAHVEALREAWFEGLPGGSQGQTKRDATDAGLAALARALKATLIEAP
ncbi:MAG: hypothetical protein GY898_01975 [Proteobacteria bacterium]|nr:hypothetical protein [Pseudomonadota bacterium]